MSRLCEGRVCIITGAGRGIGREHALMLAAHGAKVVVYDLGGTRAGRRDVSAERDRGGGGDGSGPAALGPAEEVVQEITKAGGEAIANGDDISDFAGAKRLID